MKQSLIKTGNIRTIDLNQLDWFDRANGNTYFAAEIIINYGMKSERRISLPFQYGYGSHCEYVAAEKFKWKKGEFSYLGSQCRENGIIFRHNRRDAKKRELKEIA